MTRRSSLSLRILLSLVPIFLLSLAISVVVQNKFEEAEMMDQAQTSAHTYADIIRESMVSMMVNSQEVDTMFLARVNGIPHFDSLKVLVNALKLRAELFSEEQLARIAAKKRIVGGQDEVQARVLETGQPLYVRNGDLFRAVIPFNATSVCRKCHAVRENYTIGAADLRFSMARFTTAAEGNWRRSILIFLVFTVVAIAVAVMIFRRTISRPIERLVTAATEIQKGNLARQMEVADGNGAAIDELAFLTERFEEMRASLADKIARLDEANRDLSRRNKDVEDAINRLRKAQEDLVRSERLATAGKIAAQLSHEINNPIHNTQSLLESSLRRTENPEAYELIGLALEEVKRMAALTRQLLNLYRGPVTEAEMETVDMAALLHEVVRTHRESLAEDGVTLLLQVDTPLAPVRGARDKLKQVFLNLFLNARDAMSRGGTIAINGTMDGTTVVIGVADDGPGVLPEHRDRLFDAFFSTKKEVRGVGLGLAVTYGIIRQHQGTISVESQAGRGTLFTIRIPSAGPESDGGHV